MTLELREVSLRDGAEVHIHPTTLALAPRGFNTLLGATLAGKTTLMRLMAGLVRPSAGRVQFGGRDVTGVPVMPGVLIIESMAQTAAVWIWAPARSDTRTCIRN